MLQNISKPGVGEYAPYATAYISLVPDSGHVLHQLRENASTLRQLILSMPVERLNKGYAPGKWTPKELLVHLIDAERIFTYRALCIARNDTQPLPGFEENDYVSASNANDRDIEDILEEYENVKKATLSLFNSFNNDILLRKGLANNAPVSVRALAYMVAGHEMHHINIIKERYL